MNDFGARKLGEVLAFSHVGVETLQRGSAALGQVKGLAIDDAVDRLRYQATAIESLAQELGVNETVARKAEATGGKLRAMRGMYLGNNWRDPAELLEWLGFFEGGAIVHWRLVAGVAANFSAPTMKDLASDGLSVHRRLLGQISAAIGRHGSNMSRA